MPTVLCIDDDERALFIRTKILERLNYRVLTATSADEGLRLAAREPVDAIVLDYYMPEMSGAEVATELKRRGSHVPILLLSSAVFVPDDAENLVDAFCAKIDGPTNFLDVLQQLVKTAQARGGAGKHTVLHVDDNEAQRYAISRMLQNAGFRVLQAATGTEALRLVQQHPDVVLLDVKLPDIDGIEVCRQIKANPATSCVPVLHITATPGNIGRKDEGAAAGDSGYLVHPLPPHELIAAVTSLLERSK